MVKQTIFAYSILRIVAVNGLPIDNMHHEEIIKQIKDSGYVVTLTIGAPQDVVEGVNQTPAEPSPLPQRLAQDGNPSALIPQQMQYQDQAQLPTHPIQLPLNGNADPSSYQPQFAPTMKLIEGNQAPTASSVYLTIDLHRRNGGFGFSIRGGQVGAWWRCLSVRRSYCPFSVMYE